MKYDKFISTVLEKIVHEFENPDPGLFRGHGPYDHIISNPKDSKDRESIVNSKFAEECDESTSKFAEECDAVA